MIMRNVFTPALLVTGALLAPAQTASSTGAAVSAAPVSANAEGVPSRQLVAQEVLNPRLAPFPEIQRPHACYIKRACGRQLAFR
jgi:hypothetical protein